MRAPKHLLKAHRLITGRDKLIRKAHSKAEYKHLAELRSLFEDRNIVGLGISEKTTNKKKTKEVTLCFYVQKKKARKRLGSHKLIPPVISVGGKAIFTDVYEVGSLKAQANVQDSPIQSGFSVGNDKSIHAGTVGAIVSAGGSARFILSNAHVLAPRGQGAPNINASFPAPGDNGGAPRPIGPLRHIANLQQSGNRADAALAEINAGFAINTSIVGASGPPFVVGTAVEGMSVVGRGRTSGSFSGVVKDPH